MQHRVTELSTGWEIVVAPNRQVAEHAFLKGVYEDEYFPDHVVEPGGAVRAHGGRDGRFNALEAEFEAAGSEIETFAREVIAEDFWFAASAYGFAEADAEELIAGREW